MLAWMRQLWTRLAFWLVGWSEEDPAEEALRELPRFVTDEE